MKKDDYLRIANRALASKELCKILRYDWRDDPVGIDEFRDIYFSEMKRRLSAVNHSTDNSDVETMCDTIFTEVQWNRYKKIYEFHPTFVRYLAETEAGKIEKAVLEKLPFKSFFISFGGEVLDEPVHEGHVPCVGMYVYVYFSNEDGFEFINFALSIVGNEDSSVPIYCGLKNGAIFQEATDLDKMPKAAYDFITHNGDPEQIKRVKEKQKIQYPYFMIAMNACQYLCASNAEIKEKKIPKADRPFVQNGTKKKNIGIQVSSVGYRLGEQFEKMYRNLEAETRRKGKKGIKKRPHVRRAHWHRYWTGKGRTELEVRWLEPVFVMGTEEENEIDTVIHEVKGEHGCSNRHNGRRLPNL